MQKIIYKPALEFMHFFFKSHWLCSGGAAGPHFYKNTYHASYCKKQSLLIQTSLLLVLKSTSKLKYR
ncbi:MAG: hypothetical protein A2161_15015 [Candidatus Schekmanbacteria bacterium RBG_13_48_7]|uniref:Uncharacterized protein n=1 Tax=Candidatus Schekmanbacteria bacterium RBG_13_48_7 TaxID=1817878 RepID=A0A1F7RWM4_9BACT|nr:MAG: hypothetical protein A2161_15015 [Candidatus Schekmanbacteria bacterium RBG_13_48_7]